MHPNWIKKRDRFFKYGHTEKDWDQACENLQELRDSSNKLWPSVTYTLEDQNTCKFCPSCGERCSEKSRISACCDQPPENLIWFHSGLDSYSAYYESQREQEFLKGCLERVNALRSSRPEIFDPLTRHDICDEETFCMDCGMCRGREGKCPCCEAEPSDIQTLSDF